jgi:hypothetical protein
MRQLIFVLHQFSVVLISYSFTLFGIYDSYLDALSDQYFLWTISIGLVLAVISLNVIFAQTVTQYGYEARYAVTKLVLCFVCEIGLAFIAAGLSHLRMDELVPAIIYILGGTILAVLSASGVPFVKMFLYGGNTKKDN